MTIETESISRVPAPRAPARDERISPCTTCLPPVAPDVAPQRPAQSLPPTVTVAVTGGIGGGATRQLRSVPRGLSASVSTAALRERSWHRSLLMLARFRVIRTIDIAMHCFPERPFKAALTAAQRTVRGLVKAELIRRYRTDRFQTVYGLTAPGAAWLVARGSEASASVRRVSDMTNPEHRLWAQFLVLACEARGLQALTESELLRSLNAGVMPGTALVQGLLSVDVQNGARRSVRDLRPDAMAYELDGIVWFEVDRSKRGSDREAALAALASSVGCKLKNDLPLRTVSVHCKTDRVQKRALAVLRGLTKYKAGKVLIDSGVQLQEVDEGVFEVWRALDSRLQDGRVELVDRRIGHVIVQMLPTWLPKVRIDASNRFSTAGWLEQNYLPYRRPANSTAWVMGSSPLVRTKAQMSQKPVANSCNVAILQG